ADAARRAADRAPSVQARSVETRRMRGRSRRADARAGLRPLPCAATRPAPLHRARSRNRPPRRTSIMSAPRTSLFVGRDPEVFRIAPSLGWARINFTELWRYRELMYFLTWRDVKVRYKQTAIGIAWAVVQPLFTMAVFSVFFGRLAKVPSDGVPYPIFTLAGIVPWSFFANAMAGSSAGMVENGNLIKK